MSLFRRRQRVPISIGDAVCVVDTNGRGWVGQECHADLTPDHIALLAATTFMLQGARARTLLRLPVAPWLEATRTAASYPDVFNETMNSNGVESIGPHATPPGARVRGTFSLLPTGFLTGDWKPGECFENVALASRLFGVLAAAAQWYDVGDAVEHVARRLEATAAEVDFTRPQLMAEMPQALVGYGLRQAAVPPGG